MAQSTSHATPTCLLHTSQPCRPSAHAAPVPTATASLPANAVDNPTASLMPAAIAIVHSVSTIRRGSGSPQAWHTAWNVHSQANPHGATSLQYLAPSVFKVAIANRRLVSLQDRIVTFTYRKPGSTRPRT